MKRKALIISLKGPKLLPREKTLLSKEKPWGVILFKRNLMSFNQIKNSQKGLSFSDKGKLNMRMGINDFSANEIISNMDEKNLTRVFKISGKDDIIFTKIINDEPFPIPNSVINSLNHIMTIDPVVNTKEISIILFVLKPNTNGLTRNVTSML